MNLEIIGHPASFAYWWKVASGLTAYRL